MRGGFVFQGGASFLSEGHLMGGISFDGGVRKRSLDGGVPPMPSTTMENRGHYQ